MATNKYIHRAEHQQHGNSGMAFYNGGWYVQLPDVKRVRRMAQAKMMWIIADIFGIPLYLLGIAANIDNVKSVILAILGIAYLGVRCYFYILKSKQSVREKDIDLWHKEQDKIERINGKKNTA